MNSKKAYSSREGRYIQLGYNNYGMIEVYILVVLGKKTNSYGGFFYILFINDCNKIRIYQLLPLLDVELQMEEMLFCLSCGLS